MTVNCLLTLLLLQTAAGHDDDHGDDGHGDDGHCVSSQH